MAYNVPITENRLFTFPSTTIATSYTTAQPDLNQLTLCPTPTQITRSTGYSFLSQHNSHASSRYCTCSIIDKLLESIRWHTQNPRGILCFK